MLVVTCGDMWRPLLLVSFSICHYLSVSVLLAGMLSGLDRFGCGPGVIHFIYFSYPFMLPLCIALRRIAGSPRRRLLCLSMFVTFRICQNVSMNTSDVSTIQQYSAHFSTFQHISAHFSTLTWGSDMQIQSYTNIMLS